MKNVGLIRRTALLSVLLVAGIAACGGSGHHTATRSTSSSGGTHASPNPSTSIAPASTAPADFGRRHGLVVVRCGTLPSQPITLSIYDLSLGRESTSFEFPSQVAPPQGDPVTIGCPTNRKQFDTSYTKLALSWGDPAAAGKEHVGYLDLRSRTVTDLTASRVSGDEFVPRPDESTPFFGEAGDYFFCSRHRDGTTNLVRQDLATGHVSTLSAECAGQDFEFPRGSAVPVRGPLGALPNPSGTVEFLGTVGAPGAQRADLNDTPGFAGPNRDVPVSGDGVNCGSAFAKVVGWLDDLTVVCEGTGTTSSAGIARLTFTVGDASATVKTLVPGSDVSLAAAVTSPDGRQLAFVGSTAAGADVYTVDATNGTRTKIGPIANTPEPTVVEWK